MQKRFCEGSLWNCASYAWNDLLYGSLRKTNLSITNYLLFLLLDESLFNPILVSWCQSSTFVCVHVHQCDTHFISVFMHCCWLQEVPSSCSDEPGDLARRIEIEVMKIAYDHHYFFSLRSITKWQTMIDNLLSVAAGWLLNVNSVILSISLHFTIDFCYSNENIFTQCSLYFYITCIVQTNSRHNRLSIPNCSFIS